jgi:hypothetical protein
MGEDGMVAATRTSSAWERYAWVAGILYVIALVAVSVVELLGGGLSQNASAAKIANTLHDHRGRLLVIACLSVVYIAAMFLIYLAKLYDLLRRDTDRSRYLRLARREARVVRVAARSGRVLHAVPDDLWPGQRRGRVRQSLCFRGRRAVIGSGVLPRWLGWVSILAGILFFLQAFGLGGVIASFGLVLDGIAFVLFVIFVLVSSVILLTRQKRGPRHPG